MNTTELTYLLKHPYSINPSQINDIKSIIKEFPYFQPAKALYLKVLKNEESFKYNQELKTTAAYTTDRSILFDFITSEQFSQNNISKHIRTNLEHLKEIDITAVEDISVNKRTIIDDALKQQINDTEPVLDPQLFEAKQDITNPDIIAVDVKGIEQNTGNILEIGKPLEFDKNEAHSFSEWLKITSFKPIIRQESTLQKTSKDSSTPSKSELIDKFIETNPKLEPAKKDGKLINLAKSQMIKPKSLMTETLARIYVEQKKYDKAIKSYKILSLKYPEKSGLFADQIRAIKELQKHNNK